MDDSKTCVSEGTDGDVRVIVVTLHGVPLVIPVPRPERYDAALHDAQSIAAQVRSGNLYWCDGIRHLIRFSSYYSAPLPRHTDYDLSLHHLMEVGTHTGRAALHVPAAIIHYVRDHMPLHR